MSADVLTYAAAVRAALADLPAEQREELLEDLEGHLLEVVEDGDLRERLGDPEAYAAELRASAGLPGPVVGKGWGAVLRGRASTLRRRAERVPLAQEAIAFAPDLRPGWWVVRAWLLVLVAGAVTADDGRYGMSSFPLPSVYDSTVVGVLALLGAIVVSVRLGRCSDALPRRRRRLVVIANVAVLVGATVLAADLRGAVLGTTSYYVETSSPYADVLSGPNGPISNIYPYDSQGRPLRDVQLFDQDGNPLSSLLRQAPDGRYAEPEPRFGVDGLPKPNVFPRSYRVDDYDERGVPTTRPVPPPTIAAQPLAPRATPTASGATPSPSGATPTPSVAPSPGTTPSAEPTPSG
jgi:hypothetical protein